MTDSSHVGSLRLVCRAAREQEDRALRLRSRLESTARVHLPDALERALGGDRRHVFAERVEVRLDFDPSDYDDVTLAALWAARVAGAIAEARGEDGVVVFDSEGELYAAAAAEWADTGGLAPAFETLGCGTGPRVVASELLAAFDTRERLAALALALVRRAGRLERVRARLARREREAVLAALSGERRWGEWGSGAAARIPAGREIEGADAPELDTAREDGAVSAESGVVGGPAGAAAPLAAEGERARRAWSAAWRRLASEGAVAVRFDSAPTAVAASPAGGLAGPHAAATAAPREASRTRPRERELRRRDPDARDEAGTPGERAAGRAAWLSRHAGLVLLYPWLEAHLSGDLPPADAPAGAAPETGARLWALAALAQAEPDAGAVLDPLVRALAGEDPARDLAGWRPTPPPLRGLREPAEALLARFAEALPGFAGSSPEFVRREFLERGGDVKPDGHGALAVWLEPAPLDLALVRLPYPVAPFALPWSAAIVPSLGRTGASLRSADA